MRRVLAFLLILVGCSDRTPIAEQPKPWFVDEAKEHGFDFVWESGFDGFPYNPEITMGGLAVLDVDGDVDVDIYMVQGGSLSNPEQTEFANQLYLNDGSGNFTNATKGSGAGDTHYGTGATTGDYDNDGDVDIYVTNVNENVLLRNDGGGKFSDVTTVAGVGSNRWSASSAFFDMENDGDLDLFVANYIDWSPETEHVCKAKSGNFDYCHPQSYSSPARDLLYRNNGDGTFTDVSETSGIRAVWGNGLGVVIGDVNDDGFLDIFVANDKMNNQLWVNQGDGTFIDDAIVSGVAVDANGEPKAGMGTDFADVNDDGLLDLLVVNLSGEADSLFINNGGWFSDGTPESGLSAISRPFTRFGTGFRDLNNDGFLDLYLSNGRVQLPDTILSDDPYAEHNVLVQGLGNGRFKEVVPKGGTAEELLHTSRGIAYGDMNGDGAVDIVVLNRDANAYLLMNQNPEGGSFVKLRLVNQHGAPAQDAVVRFTLGDRDIRREVRTGGGYCSAHDPTLHIGLGINKTISGVEVTWSDGTTQMVGSVQAGSIETIHQSK
jgi:enediyne biosynthesis protein E4